MNLGTNVRPAKLAGFANGTGNQLGVNSSVILNIASDLMYAPSDVTSTMLLMSSASLPLAWSKALPTLLCNALKRSFAEGSQSRARLTAPLHMLQTPSNNMTGRLSVAKTRCDTIDGSATLSLGDAGEEVLVVVELVVERSSVCEAMAGRIWSDVNDDARCEAAAMIMARSNVCLFIIVSACLELGGSMYATWQRKRNDDDSTQ